MPEKFLLTVEEQIIALKEKGVQFCLCTEDEAKVYLTGSYNYFKLKAYGKNFRKHPGGNDIGKYANLDFAMLQDLAEIDQKIRYTFIILALEVEHFAKIHLLDVVLENSDIINPYQVVSDFLQDPQYHYVQKDLDKQKSNPYCSELIKKYESNYPIWVFLELISFGTLIHLYEFIGKKLSKTPLLDEYYQLKLIRQLRNACAHNNCIIRNISEKNATGTYHTEIQQKLASVFISTKTVFLRNTQTRQLITMLFLVNKMVHNELTKTNAKKKLNDLAVRMKQHSEYYKKEKKINDYFDFLIQCIKSIV